MMGALTLSRFYVLHVFVLPGAILTFVAVHIFLFRKAGAAGPMHSKYLPRPEWYYLPFFQWLKFRDGAKTVIGVVLIPAILIILVFLLPFLDRGRQRLPWKRSIPVGSGLIVLIGMIWLGLLGKKEVTKTPTWCPTWCPEDFQEKEKVPLSAFLRGTYAIAGAGLEPATPAL